MAEELMIQAEGLKKRYGETQALDGVSFSVPAGTILGLLGPNGAGKTTAVRILTTLALPDARVGLVAGLDVVKQPHEVRRHIGVAAQDATLDQLLTGRQNLVLVGELSDMGRAESRARAEELLDRFELTFAADRVRQGLLGRHAAPARPGGVDDDAPAGAVPRRADHGVGPGEPPAVSGTPSASCSARA